MTKAKQPPGAAACAPAPPARVLTVLSQAHRRPAGRWRQAFLEALAATSNVTKAAAIAHIDLGRVYRTRARDPKFAAEWRRAIALGYQNLELEVLAQLREPEAPPRIDIANALRLLAHHRAAVASQRAEDENLPEDEALAQVEAALDAIRLRAVALPPRREADHAPGGPAGPGDHAA